MHPDIRTARRRAQLQIMPKPLTPDERDAIIRSGISSWALSGITVPRAEAEAALDRALARPLPEIGGEDATA